MENSINFNILPEKDVIRNDEASELDIAIEIKSGEEKEREKFKQTLSLCIVIDRSGSMAGEKLETAKKSCIEIFKALKKDDLFTVVVYDGEAEVIINPQTDKKDVISKIQKIASGGSTNLSLGWYLGLLELQTYLADNQINRLIMLSDGEANEGETKISILGNQSLKIREEFGIITSTIGIGESFNEVLLNALASESGGRFWYIKEANIEKIIEAEFKGTSDILLENPKVEIALPKGFSISTELNGLRKIFDKYSLPPITTNHYNIFAVRLQIVPELIEAQESTLRAVLYNGSSKISECSIVLKSTTFDQLVKAQKNPVVLSATMMFEKSKTEEKMITKLDLGEFDFMKSLIVQEVDGMKKVIDKMEDERRKKDLMKEASDLLNMSVIYDLLQKLENLDSKKYASTIQEFIMHSKKLIGHQNNRHVNMHKRVDYDDEIQFSFLKDTLLLVESLIEDYPKDLELITIKKEINEKMASY